MMRKLVYELTSKKLLKYCYKDVDFDEILRALVFANRGDPWAYDYFSFLPPKGRNTIQYILFCGKHSFMGLVSCNTTRLQSVLTSSEREAEKPIFI